MERPGIRMTMLNDYRTKILMWVFVVLSVFLTPPDSLYGWELAKEDKKNEIEVYTRRVEASNFKEYRAVMKVKTSLSSLVALVDDISACHSWIDTCREGRLLKRISPKETYNYTINDAPWPVSDRDAAVLNTISQDPKNRIVTIKIEGVPEYIPPQKGLVRVKMIKGYWQFTPLENSCTKVVYQVHNDPGGDLPSWLVNSVAVSQPYNTLLNMKKIVSHPKYQEARYEFIKE